MPGSRNPSLGRGFPRVSSGVSSSWFPALQTTVFSCFQTRFCAEKVLRELVASTYFWLQKRGRGSGRSATYADGGGKRTMERKGAEVGETRNNASETAVRDCRGLAFHIGPRLQKNSPCV